MAEDEADPMARCSSIVSFDKRLLFEQLGIPGKGHCSNPVRTRVTDQFLGFTCYQLSPENIACRSFIPRLDSRAFDTAKRFRCVDVAVTDNDGSVAIHRLREWAAPPRQCEWDPAAGVLAMEVDFAQGQVCLATFCINVDRLSPIGKTRLKRLISSALEELNLRVDRSAARDARHPVGMVSP
jgi:hypothetical protein